MLTICNPDFELIHCSVQSLMFSPLTVAHNIDYPKKNPHCTVWIAGSCNGLICVAIDESDMFLWNPTTRTSKKLPLFAVTLRQGFYYIWRFGYDESSDDYKVVSIFCVFGNEGLYESVVKIYSLRADSWKSIGGFEGGVPLDDSEKFTSGKIPFPGDTWWVGVQVEHRVPRFEDRGLRDCRAAGLRGGLFRFVSGAAGRVHLRAITTRKQDRFIKSLFKIVWLKKRTKFNYICRFKVYTSSSEFT
ncbi:F-box/kelch-repeat protein at3g06240 [Phtheirospermum japonicum]|uniref:F-box/kelch-repeat protein at3g06240 n=1 Tax=Phtheirospermum japonicum TaxID=374723 RepID=A0A830D0G6_9LAMI|nr:F-box/kelch-repeat protein at3g06240 [Phtheirospermum japonicum]